MNNDKKGGVRLLTGAWKHFRTITYHKYLVMKGLSLIHILTLLWVAGTKEEPGFLSRFLSDLGF